MVDTSTRKTYFQTISSHAPKYFTGSTIAAGMTLLMTKYYTLVFTPEVFGILAMYLVMFKFIMAFCSLNLDSGSTRFYFDYRKTAKHEYLSTIFWLITFVSILVLIASLIFMDFISNWIHPGSENVYIITLISGILAVYVSFLIRVLYNEQKSTSVLKHGIFQTFVNHISSVVFISIFNLGIFGRMMGQSTGYSLNILTLFNEFYKERLFHLKLVFNRSMANDFNFFINCINALWSNRSNWTN